MTFQKTAKKNFGEVRQFALLLSLLAFLQHAGSVHTVLFTT